MDTSVLIALLTADAHAARADAYFRNRPVVMIVSDFASAEFSAVAARQVRAKAMTTRAARALFADLDTFKSRAATPVESQPGDLPIAEGFIRRLDLSLRAPDALHIAIARRLGAELATFDDQMSAAARTLGLTVSVL